MSYPFLPGLITTLVVTVSALLAEMAGASSTPFQEYCIYANFTKYTPYGSSSSSGMVSNRYSNWRSGQQYSPSRVATQRPFAPAPSPMTQTRPTARPFASSYSPYYLRGSAYSNNNYRGSPYYRPTYSGRYRNRFVRDTLASFGVNASEMLPEDDETPVSRNIIAGEPIEQKSWPFLVALLTTGDTIKINNKYWDLVCGGTLIHPQFILTAAHCFVDEGVYTWKFMEASDFIVRIGDFNLLVPNDVPNAIDARVLRYKAHPRYDHKVVENGYDIALIQLDRPVQYNDWIQPACLPDPQNSSQAAIPRPNLPCQVAGWGAVNNAGRLSPIPRVTTLPSSRLSLCYNSLQVPTVARDGRLFCAGDLTGTKDSCSGDSGGPIFCLRENKVWELSGIVSFGGERCAQQSIPGAYTTISYFLNWIQSSLSNLLAQSNTPDPVEEFTSFTNTMRQIGRQPPAPSRPRPPPPSRYNLWQPHSINSRTPASKANPAPAPTPRSAWESNSTEIHASDNSTTTNRSPAALLNLLQVLMNTFGGGSRTLSMNSDSDDHTLQRIHPLEVNLP